MLLARVFVVLSLGLLSACTTLQPATDDPSLQTSFDPLEGWNRGVHTFNDTVDRVALRTLSADF